MRTAKKLKLIIDIFSIVFIITLVTMIVNALLFYYKAHSFNNNIGAWAQKSINSFAFNHTFVIAKGILLIIGVLYLRKAIKAILIKDYFSIEVTKNIKRTGIVLILTGVISLAMTVKFTLNNINTFGLNYDSIFQVESFWGFFIIIIGLFFVLVSYLFSEARNLKEENELTI